MNAPLPTTAVEDGAGRTTAEDLAGLTMAEDAAESTTAEDAAERDRRQAEVVAALAAVLPAHALL